METWPAGHRELEEDSLPMGVAASFYLREASSAQGNGAQKSACEQFFVPRVGPVVGFGSAARNCRHSARARDGEHSEQLHLTRAPDTNKREAGNEDSLFQASGSSPRAGD